MSDSYFSSFLAVRSTWRLNEQTGHCSLVLHNTVINKMFLPWQWCRLLKWCVFSIVVLSSRTICMQVARMVYTSADVMRRVIPQNGVVQYHTVIFLVTGLLRSGVPNLTGVGQNTSIINACTDSYIFLCVHNRINPRLNVHSRRWKFHF